MPDRIDFLVDTNFVIYYLAGHHSVAQYDLYRFSVSVITELELLSKPDMADEEEGAIQVFLADCLLFGLTANIRQRAIQIIRTHRLKLPDALIAATAIEADLPLVTADQQFARVSGLNLILLDLQ